MQTKAQGFPVFIRTGWENWLTLTLFFFALIAIIVFNYSFFFIDTIVPTGDAASTDILITQAKSFSLFHGHYSRIGFYHPGPFYIYLLAIGEFVFYDATKFVTSSYAAQKLIAIIFGLSAAAFYFRLWLSITNQLFLSGLILAVTLAVITWRLGPTYLTGADWPPLMFLASGLMAVTGLIGFFFEDNPKWLVLLTVSLLQLIHGHASFIGIVPMMVVCGIGGLAFLSYLGLFSFKEKIQTIIELRWVIPVLFSLVFLFIMPILLQTILYWPGEIPKYFAFASTNKPNEFINSFLYLSDFFPIFGIWLGALALKRNLLMQQKASITAEKIWGIGILLLITFIPPTFYYVCYGIDDLRHTYVIFWFCAFVGAIAAICVNYLVFFLENNFVKIIAGFLIAYISFSQLNTQQRISYYPHHTEVYSMALNQLAEVAPKGGRLHLTFDSNPEAWDQIWPDIAALLSMMNRQGKNFLCIDETSWQLVFDKKFRCSNTRNYGFNILYVTPLINFSDKSTLAVKAANIVITKVDNANKISKIPIPNKKMLSNIDG